jgi:hypothetical protein
VKKSGSLLLLKGTEGSLTFSPSKNGPILYIQTPAWLAFDHLNIECTFRYKSIIFKDFTCPVSELDHNLNLSG